EAVQAEGVGEGDHVRGPGREAAAGLVIGPSDSGAVRGEDPQPEPAQHLLPDEQRLQTGGRGAGEVQDGRAIRPAELGACQLPATRQGNLDLRPHAPSYAANERPAARWGLTTKSPAAAAGEPLNLEKPLCRRGQVQRWDGSTTPYWT